MYTIGLEETGKSGKYTF